MIEVVASTASSVFFATDVVKVLKYSIVLDGEWVSTVISEDLECG